MAGLRCRVIVLSSLVTFAFLAGAKPVIAQELEPRTYSATPINSNFAIGALSIRPGLCPSTRRSRLATCAQRLILPS